MKHKIFSFFLFFSFNSFAVILQTINIDPDMLAADKRRGITYLNDIQRKNYLLRIDKNGKFFYANRSPNEVEVYGKFVMDGKGDIYFASYQELGTCKLEKGFLLNHASFLAGGPVAMAGILTFKEGKIKEVINNSGHYRPPKEFFNQFLKELSEKGVKYKFTVKSFVDEMEKIDKMFEDRKTGKCNIL